MARKKKVAEAGVTENLASALHDLVNKKVEKDLGYQAAYFLGGTQDNPANIKEWVSTGSDMLDLAISNRPNGGLPVGRIVEVTGLEGSGKSLICAHILAETQKKGGLAVYIDTESALDETFFGAVGVEIDKMLYVQLEHIEDIFGVIEDIIVKVRESSKDRLVTIIVDSIMGSTTRKESQADYGKDGYATDKAIILSKAMRKITNMIARERILLVATNQLRIKMNAMFGDPYTTSGGKALAFHSSVRLRMKLMGKITAKVHGIDTVVGGKTKVQVVKNRLGPPHKVINYEIYFASGIDNFGGWLHMLKAYKIVKQAGAWYQYTPEGAEEPIKFQSKDFNELILADPVIKKEIYDKLCAKYIMQYTPGRDGGIDDVKILDVADEGTSEADALDGAKLDDGPGAPDEQLDDDDPSALGEEIEDFG